MRSMSLSKLLILKTELQVGIGCFTRTNAIKKLGVSKLIIELVIILSRVLKNSKHTTQKCNDSLLKKKKKNHYKSHNFRGNISSLSLNKNLDGFLVLLHVLGKAIFQLLGNEVLG